VTPKTVEYRLQNWKRSLSSGWKIIGLQLSRFFSWHVANFISGIQVFEEEKV